MDLTKILKVNDVVYSPIGGNGVVVSTNYSEIFPIRIQWANNLLSAFTKDGKFFTDSPECSLFPSKEHRDWNTFKGQKEIPFKPFDKVLVRDSVDSKWKCGFFSDYEPGSIYPFTTTHGFYKQCISYNSETEHLIGTKEDCPSKYKIWE